MIKKKVILICGNATVGKDSLTECFLDILSEKGVRCSDEAFADSIKFDLIECIDTRLKIDVLLPSPEEKKIIRPILVAYGEAAKKVNPLVWVDSVLDRIKYKKENNDEIIIISDCRFPIEIERVKEFHDVKIIHLSRFVEKEGEKHFIPPANQNEQNTLDLFLTTEYLEKIDRFWTWGNLFSHNERKRWLEKELEKPENLDIKNWMFCPEAK